MRAAIKAILTIFMVILLFQAVQAHVAQDRIYAAPHKELWAGLHAAHCKWIGGEQVIIDTKRLFARINTWRAADGVPFTTIKRWLRHADLKTTAIYTNAAWKSAAC